MAGLVGDQLEQRETKFTLSEHAPATSASGSPAAGPIAERPAGSERTVRSEWAVLAEGAVFAEGAVVPVPPAARHLRGHRRLHRALDVALESVSHNFKSLSKMHHDIS